MKAIKAVLKVLPFALIPAIIYTLEYFGRKRMGMMRYLVFMKREFENGTFQPLVTYGILGVAVLFTGILLVLLIKSGLKQNPHLRYWLYTLIMLDLWLILPQTKALKSFHFGLIGWLVLVGLTTLINLWRMQRRRRVNM